MKYRLLLLLLITTCAVSAQSAIDTAKSQFAKIDDVTIHYKVFGYGDALFLLHGSLECMDDWSNQVLQFAKRYKVILMDNRGHGRSTFTDRPMDYNLLSEDVLGLMTKLKIDSAHIIGFGDGGIIGLTLAINHPDKVRKLVAIGANYKVDTTVVSSDVLKKVEEYNDDKMYSYIRNKFKGYPNYDKLKQFTERLKTMLLTEPKFDAADLKKIQCPVLFMAGDHDIIKLNHTQEMFETVKRGYLSIISGCKHYPHKEKPTVVNPIMLDFLNKQFVKLSGY